jgi:hypothetical protein
MAGMAWLRARRRRLLLSWDVLRARYQLRRLGMRVPSGAWFCEPCQMLMWDEHRFDMHVRVHAG